MDVSRLDFYKWTDFFRFAAAAIVALSHVRDIVMVDYTGNKLFAPFYAATGLGHSGVIVFFVLSGFWISQSVLRKIDDRHFWLQYFIDRISRLVIVLIPALLLGGLLDVLGIYWLNLPIYTGQTGSHSLLNPVADNLSWPIFLGNALFLQKIFVSTWGSNGPLWSLSFEFWYYIWFPALVILIAKRRLSLALLALAIGFMNRDLAIGFMSWLVGTALLKSLARWSVFQFSGVVSKSVAWGFGLLFLAMLLVSGLLKNIWFDLPLAISFACCLYGIAQGQIAFPKWLNILAHYGQNSSFSLYIIHFPVVALVGGLAARQHRLLPEIESVGIVLALTIFCICLGWVFSQFTEKHTPSLRKFLRAKF